MPAVEAFRVCIPDRPDQERISAQLDGQFTSIDEARKAAIEQLRSIEALPSAYFRRAFAGEI